MKAVRALFSWPLLAKELTELAARRRTYVTRVVYAVLLYGFFALLNGTLLRELASWRIQVFGAGRQMFFVLVGLQLAGIYLFLPAMTAGLITQEKERDSLVLLFLTELRPWQILLQKYASGLIAILSFLLIGMPLVAFAYSLGGVSPEMLFTGFYVLLLTSLQVAAFALLWSAWARSTVTAFISTYVGGGALFFGLLVFGTLPEWMRQWSSRRGSFAWYVDVEDWLEKCLSIFPPMLLKNSHDEVAAVLIGSIPSLFATAVFLVLARFFFVRRAYVAPTNRLLAFFQRLDAAMHRWNRLVGNVSIRTRQRALPEDDPIAWREMTRRSLGRPEYLTRVLIALEIPTVFFCLFASMKDHGSESFALSLVAAVLGTLAVLTLSASAANAFVSERVNQTIEVLLTTPLHAVAIVRQKARTLTRLRWVLAVPIMTVFIMECWVEKDLFSGGRYWWHDLQRSSALYLVCSFLTLAVYLPLIMWLSLWIGLKMRTRFRAIVTALAVIVSWCAIPGILGELVRPGARLDQVLMILCPLRIPAANELSSFAGLRLHPNDELALVAGNFAVYGLILLLIRRRCLANADHYLRR